MISRAVSAQVHSRVLRSSRSAEKWLVLPGRAAAGSPSLCLSPVVTVHFIPDCSAAERRPRAASEGRYRPSPVVTWSSSWGDMWSCDRRAATPQLYISGRMEAGEKSRFPDLTRWLDRQEMGREAGNGERGTPDTSCGGRGWSQVSKTGAAASVWD